MVDINDTFFRAIVDAMAAILIWYISSPFPELSLCFFSAATDAISEISKYVVTPSALLVLSLIQTYYYSFLSP